MSLNKEEYMLGLLRISLGWIFLWAFIDKLLGLGFATKAEDAWLAGGSPTFGFLKFGVHGPLAPFYNSIAGSSVVEWLFMIGLLGIGLSLITGIGVKVAGYTGSLMMLLMWSALLPPEHNPLIDEHIIYIFALLIIVFTRSGRYLGFGKWWSKRKIVRNYSFLE